jgi:hypothetical protein
MVRISFSAQLKNYEQKGLQNAHSKQNQNYAADWNFLKAIPLYEELELLHGYYIDPVQ